MANSFVFTFQWPFEGHEVQLYGSWDNWAQPVPMKNRGGVFEVEKTFSVAALPIQYKFWVDGEWKFDNTKNTLDAEYGGQHILNNAILPEDVENAVNTTPRIRQRAITRGAGL